MNLRCITGRNQANFFHPCKCTGNLPSRQSLFSVWDFCLALLFWGVELRKREEWPGLFSSICPFLAPPTVRVPSAEQTPPGAVQWAVSPPSSEHIPADAEACRNSQDTRGVFPGFQGRSSMLQHLTGLPLPVCTGLQPGSPPALLRRGSSSANWPWGVVWVGCFYPSVCPYSIMKMECAGREGLRLVGLNIHCHHQVKLHTEHKM